MNSDSSGDVAAQIDAANRRFMRLFAANDIAGVAACYTEDAEMMPSNMEAIRGRDAIASVFKFTGGRGHTLGFESQELDVHGDTAVELGKYVRRQSDGSTYDRGKYIVVWKRVGGEWKMHRDMFGSSMPRTAAAAALL